MQYFNLKDPSQVVSFSEAIQLGLGNDQGLFMPVEIPELFERQIDELLAMDFVTRSIEILEPFVAPDIDRATLKEIITSGFNFPVKVASVNADKEQYALELFHGPSLAFKDFGARFLARCLGQVLEGEETTILTATSGDTGAAVAHAFFGIDNVRVCILYPKGKISPLQEKLFCTLGFNIETLAVDGDFDACQALVKQAFSDQALRKQISISSANSINVARLLAQVCYYFEIFSQQSDIRNVCVPSGNFGNLTAGLIAKAMGLPIEKIMAATNANDTVPRFFETGKWDPRPTIATLSNAMDVAQPNNFPRVEYLVKKYGLELNKDLFSVSVNDDDTQKMLRQLARDGYIADPHTSLGLFASRDWENTAVLSTAHPAKFFETMKMNGVDIPLPAPLAKVQDQTILSQDIAADYSVLREMLLDD